MSLSRLQAVNGFSFHRSSTLNLAWFFSSINATCFYCISFRYLWDRESECLRRQNISRSEGPSFYFLNFFSQFCCFSSKLRQLATFLNCKKFLWSFRQQSCIWCAIFFIWIILYSYLLQYPLLSKPLLSKYFVRIFIFSEF